MYNQKFNLYYLFRKQQRIEAEVSYLEKRLADKKRLLENIKWQRIDQEFKLNKLVNTE